MTTNRNEVEQLKVPRDAEEYQEYLKSVESMNLTASQVFLRSFDSSDLEQQLLSNPNLLNGTLRFLEERGWVSASQLHKELEEGTIQNVRRWFSKDNPVQPSENIRRKILDSVKTLLTNYCDQQREELIGAADATSVVFSRSDEEEY